MIVAHPTASTGDEGPHALLPQRQCSALHLKRFCEDVFASRDPIDVETCPTRAGPPDHFNHLEMETDMSKGERHGNREVKKPKKEKIKVIAAAPSQKGGQPSFAPGKKK